MSDLDRQPQGICEVADGDDSHFGDEHMDEDGEHAVAGDRYVTDEYVPEFLDRDDWTGEDDEAWPERRHRSLSRLTALALPGLTAVVLICVVALVVLSRGGSAQRRTAPTRGSTAHLPHSVVHVQRATRRAVIRRSPLRVGGQRRQSPRSRRLRLSGSEPGSSFRLRRSDGPQHRLQQADAPAATLPREQPPAAISPTVIRSVVIPPTAVLPVMQYPATAPFAVACPCWRAIEEFGFER